MFDNNVLQKFDVQKESLPTILSVDTIAELFFLLDDKTQKVLSQEENTKELHRRVTVFHDAIKKSYKIHDVIKDAYKNTPHKNNVSKKEYIQWVAQWFLSILLLGDDTKKEILQENIDAVRSRLIVLLWINTSNKGKEILAMMKSIMQTWYPEKIVSNYGLRIETHNHRNQIVNILNQVKGWSLNSIYRSNQELDILFQDILIIKRKYRDIAYVCYEQQFDHRDKIESINISKDEFIVLLDKLIRIILQVREIRQKESYIGSQIIDIITNDTKETPDNKNITQLLHTHVSTYDIWDKYGWYRHDEKARYTKLDTKNFHEYGTDRDIIYKIEGIEIESPYFWDIIKEYEKYKTIKGFDKQVWQADYEKIQNDKKLLWAKGAYLNEVSLFLEKLQIYNKKNRKFDIKIQVKENWVPPYQTIGIDKYIQWEKTGKLDDEYFRPIYTTWEAKKVPIIIRSSAVNSEDNEISTGAWIYHSEKVLLNNMSYESFCAAILMVYTSCNSQRAKKYRKDIGITSESMGLVVEEFIDGDFGHVNSIVPYRPELLELISGNEKWLRPIIRKDILFDAIFSDSDKLFRHEKLFHYILDSKRTRFEEINYTKDIAVLVELLERYFNQPIQVEFVFESYYEEDKTEEVDGKLLISYGDKIETIYIVQVRPLPKGMQEKRSMEFPQESTAVWKWRSIWVCDEEYTILPTGQDNTNKTGVVIFADNEYASLHQNFVENSLPKKWVVIIKSPGWAEWHIETLCIERGITCLFPTPEKHNIMSSSLNMFNAVYLWLPYTHNVKKSYEEFEWYKKIRVVADGLEGKVYGVKWFESKKKNTEDDE